MRQRTIALADGSIGSSFLDLFGRPARDTGFASERDNRPPNRQRLHLLNSSQVRQKITKSHRLRMLMKSSRGRTQVFVRSLYVMLLSRNPTPRELAAAERYGKRAKLGAKQAAEDLAWALINTKEFLYRH